MDSSRSNEKDPPIPLRRSIDSGVSGSPPIPVPLRSSINSGRGTPTRDEDIPTPQEDDRDRPEQAPRLKTTSSHTRDVSPNYSTSNTHLCQKCIPANESKFMCVPAQMVHLYRRQDVSDQPATLSRHSTYIQQDVYGQPGQDVHGQKQEYTLPSEKYAEIKSQRSNSSSIERHSKLQPTKPQKTSATTDRPPWRGVSRCTSKEPSIYPLKPLPLVSKPTSAVAPVRQHQNESQMAAYEYRNSAKHTQNSTKPIQISARQSQTNVKHIQHSNKHRNSNSYDLNQSSETRRSSQVSDIATVHQQVLSDEHGSTNLSQLPDDSRLSSTARSDDDVRFGDSRHVMTGVPVRRSSERVNVQRVADEDSLSTPIHYRDDNVRFDAENNLSTVGPNRRSSERIREECATIMEKLNAELALTGDFPSKDRLCVRLSLGENLTSDGQRKSFAIREQPRGEPHHLLPEEQAQDEAPEVYATPSAPSPRISAQFEALRRNESIPEAIVEDSSDADVKNEEYEEIKERSPIYSNTPVDWPQPEEVPMPPSIEEIFPPPGEDTTPPLTRTILEPSVEEIMPPANDSPPFLTEPLSSAHDDGVHRKPAEHPQKKFHVHLDRDSSEGIKTNLVENEALNTEFLYYSSALKNLLPVLSSPDDRCRLVPWVKKLFSPEYCARLLRDKRNRFLLHLALVLCNDEVIGVFRKLPPEGTMPSVDELCSTRYPPAGWECDSAWLDHLEDVPPGLARMPCPWHSFGCPAPDVRAADTTSSNEGPACPEICYPGRHNGTGNEASFGWSLDQEFKLLLYLSRPLKPLMKVSRDRQKMAAWLRFLCTVTPDCCVALRSLRNDYAKLLLAYGQDDRMTGPFAVDPVWGQPLPPMGSARDTQQARPFADPASGDVDEFLRAVPVPNEGAFCYVAVDGIPVAPITRPTASASLLQR